MNKVSSTLKVFYSCLLLLLLSFINCKNPNPSPTASKLENNTLQSLTIKTELGKALPARSNKLEIQTADYETKNYEKGEKLLIVMIYGLTLVPSNKLSNMSLKVTEADLKQTYPNADLNFLHIEFAKPLAMTMKNQSEEINNQMTNFFEKNKSMRGARIIFIGLCTGAIAAYETYRIYKNKYNIVGIISSGAPWQGAEVFVNRHEGLTWMFFLTLGLPFLFHYTANRPPIKELTPGSCFLKALEKSMQTCDIPIWAIGGRSNFYKNFRTTSVGKLYIRDNATANMIFGSKEHDGLIGLESQIASQYPKIKSIIVNEPANHTTGARIALLKGMNIIIKLFGFAISSEDKAKMRYLEKEPSINQTNNYICLVNKFIEKYGLFPNKEYPEDDAIIRKCQNVPYVTKQQIEQRQY